MRNLVRRSNPYSRKRRTKEEYKTAFQSLSDKGISNIEEGSAKNGATYLIFKKNQSMKSLRVQPS